MAASRPPLLVRLLACAALAVAIVPATAHAESNLAVPAAEPLMTTAHALAIARWGMDPCGGQVAVSWTHMGLGINARSQWMSIDANDPTSYSECAVAYNLDVSWDWPKLCTVTEHELGHLSGRVHVNDPHDVMSPYYVYPAPECAPAATAAPPAAPDTAPRKATSVAASRRAAAARAAAAKRKASAKRKAKSHRKPKSQRSTSKGRKSSKRRKSSKPRTTARVALAASLYAPSAADFSGAHFFGCVLAGGR